VQFLATNEKKKERGMGNMVTILHMMEQCVFLKK